MGEHIQCKTRKSGVITVTVVLQSFNLWYWKNILMLHIHAKNIFHDHGNDIKDIWFTVLGDHVCVK